MAGYYVSGFLLCNFWQAKVFLSSFTIARITDKNNFMCPALCLVSPVKSELAPDKSEGHTKNFFPAPEILPVLPHFQIETQSECERDTLNLIGRQNIDVLNFNRADGRHFEKKAKYHNSATIHRIAMIFSTMTCFNRLKPTTYD